MDQLDTNAFVDRAERNPVNMRGIALGPVTEAGRSRDSDIYLADISYAGCKFRSNDQFEPGEQVELRVFKRGLVQAEIRWVRDGRVGAQFLS
jgi:hypothetical protein